MPLLTWWLSRAGLQVTGLFPNRLHKGVAATNDILPLVAFHITHSHSDAAGLCALGSREEHRWQDGIVLLDTRHCFYDPSQLDSHLPLC